LFFILHTSAAMIALTVASPTVTVAHLKVRALYRRRKNKYLQTGTGDWDTGSSFYHN
jgi:hypothetical protein